MKSTRRIASVPCSLSIFESILVMSNVAKEYFYHNIMFSLHSYAEERMLV